MAMTPELSINVLPKATKILTIRLHHKKPFFLQLPRELRDEIYSLLLTEPSLYNKRHKPGCAAYNRDSVDETRPIQYRHIDACKKHCIRRENFGLLRGVNKQVHAEASDVFWRVNTICFSSRQDALDVLESLPDAGSARVRRLAIWDGEQLTGKFTADNVWRDLARQVHMLGNLQCLECTAEDVSHILLENSWRLPPKLETLKMWELVELGYAGDGYHWVNVHAGFFRQWDIPKCPRAKGRGGWCVPCQDTMEDLDVVVTAWTRRESPPLRTAIGDELRRLQPAKEGDGAFKLTVTIPSGEKELVHVWGLPLETYEVRSARKWRQERMEMLARAVPRRKIVYEEEEDQDDAVVIGSSAVGSRRTRLEVKVDHEVELEARAERKTQQVVHQAVARKKEVAARETMRRKGEKEVAKMRKAANTRAGRRSPKSD